MKRLLSILLCVTLATVLVPTAALAEDGAGLDAPAAETGEPISPAEPAPSPLPEESDSTGGQDTPDPAPVSPAVTGVTVTANGITEEAGASPSQLDGYYTYSEDLHTLTVLQDGVTLSGSSEDLAVKTADGLNSVTLQKLSLGADLPFQSGSGSLTVTVADTVSLTGSGSSAIRCGGALTIQGGILKAAGERQGIDAQGYPLTLTGVDLEVSGSDCGLRAAGGALTIDSARVIAQGQQDGICTDGGSVTVTDATVTTTGTDRCGLRSTGGGSLSVTDSTLSATGGQYGVYTDLTALSLEGATVTATGTDHCGLSFSGTTLDAELGADLTAQGGQHGVSAPNSTVILNGATVTATGTGGSGLHCPDGTLTVSGDAYLVSSGGQYGISAENSAMTFDCAVAEITGDSVGLYCPGSTLAAASNTELIASGGQRGISAENSDVTIDMATSVTATGTADHGLSCRSLTMTGGSDLTANGGASGLSAAGGKVYIESSAVTATGNAAHGICVSSPAVRSAGAQSGQETYMDNAPLVFTTNSAVTAEGALAGIATDCDVIIRDSAAFSSGGDWGGIRLCDSLSTGAIGSGGASLTLAGATEITGGPDSDLAASGQLLIDLTRGGSVQAAGVRSGTAITCGDKTCIVTPENGFIGPCTDGGNGQTCYTVFAPAQGDTPATVAEEVAFACTEDGPTYTVTFDSNGGSPVESQTVLSGSCAQPPEEPTRDGSFFLYWADETGAEYSFATPVTADLILTAVWTGGPEDTYTITFDTRGGSRVDRQTVPIGSRARKPKDPVKSGCTFQYWECEDGNEYDFDTPVASDVTLMAVWAPRAAGGAHSSAPNSSHSSSTVGSRRSGKSAASPETGDGFHPVLLVGALALSGGGIAALAFLRRRSAD